eukprot:jgi/Botrbrau1/6970/Bobra.0165s0008.1
MAGQRIGASLLGALGRPFGRGWGGASCHQFILPCIGTRSFSEGKPNTSEGPDDGAATPEDMAAQAKKEFEEWKRELGEEWEKLKREIPALPRISVEEIFNAPETRDEVVEVINAAGDGVPAWEFLGADDETLTQSWVFDMVGGLGGRVEENARLSDDAKKYMYILHMQGMGVADLADMFRIRKQRVMAIIALQHLEAQDRLDGQPLLHDFALKMDGGRLGPSPFDPLVWLSDPDSKVSLADIADQRLVQRLRDEYGFYHPGDAPPGAGPPEETAAPAGTGDPDAPETVDSPEAAATASGDTGAGAMETGEPAGPRAAGPRRRGAAAEGGPDEGQEVAWQRPGELLFKEDPEGLTWLEGYWNSDRLVGNYERHIRLLPTYPAFEVIIPAEEHEQARHRSRETEDQDSDVASEEALEAGLEHDEDMETDPILRGVTFESYVGPAEEAQGEEEERTAVEEFRENLLYNLRWIGEDIQTVNRGKKAAKRPEGGYSLVVHPLGKGSNQEPYAAAPDGSRRELTPSERLYAKRMKPKPRRSLQ